MALKKIRHPKSSKKKTIRKVRKTRVIPYISNKIFYSFPKSHQLYLIEDEKKRKSYPKIKSGPRKGEVDWDKMPVLDSRF
jgi:hypothetical protein